MHRYLVSDDIERHQCSFTVHRNLHFGSGRALHQPDHAVLRHLYSGNDLFIDLDDSVSLHQASLFRGSSVDGTEYYSRIIRDIEGDADTFEIAGKFCFGLRQLHRRQINGMRIKLRQGSHNCGICHTFLVNSIDIMFLYLLKNEIEFPPSVVISVKLLVRKHLEHDQGKKHSQDNTQECDNDIVFFSVHISQPAPLLSLPWPEGRCHRSDGTDHDILHALYQPE